MTSKIIKTVQASNIPIQDLTEVILDGDGVFDKFLTLHRAVLDREYSKGRIVGKEYSDTFTRTYTANLELAISFLLAKEKQAYEIELQEAQIKKAEADTAIALKQLEIMTAKMSHEIRLIEATADKMVSDAAIAEKQLEFMIAKFPLEVRLTEAQIDKMEAEVLIANKQIELVTKELTLKDKELLQKDKELELLEESLKLQKQKIITEKAQTQAGIAEEGSIIDTNIKALLAQIEGMDRDAKQKVASLLVSTWNTRMNNDEALPNIENYLTDPGIGQAIQDVLASVDMTVLPDSER